MPMFDAANRRAQGIFGWGESGLSGGEKAVAGAIEHYREFLSRSRDEPHVPWSQPFSPVAPETCAMLVAMARTDLTCR
ncbi:MAG: hypothetical protein Q7T08_08635 [Devosia sp.]|nr:hypothetical protein [Devosia sp.]